MSTIERIVNALETADSIDIKDVVGGITQWGLEAINNKPTHTILTVYVEQPVGYSFMFSFSEACLNSAKILGNEIHLKDLNNDDYVLMLYKITEHLI